MSVEDQTSKISSSLFLSPSEYFDEVVTEAFTHRRIRTYPAVKSYIVRVLEYYLDAENLFDECRADGKRTRATLAETFLRAANAEPALRVELLKKLGDSSLYISGFFGSSLARKIVDVDYYADMGGTAYASLANCVQEDTLAQVYGEIGSRFLEFVEVLTYISSKASLQVEENILRLYEHYALTGSETAREQLLAKGLIVVPPSRLKPQKQ